MSAYIPEELDLWMTAVTTSDDQEAYQQVVNSCHHLVRAVVLKETADPDLADEISQEVFVRGWVKRDQYTPGTNPRAWLLAITRSQIMDFRRRQSRDNRHLRELIRRELLRRSSQADDAESKGEDRIRVLGECLATLDEDQKELLDLIHGQGLSTNDAAEVVGIQPPTCRQRLSRLQRA
ncbi:MAG: sigma-70 family RNA polymerase sigma factor, partial [Planctomycetes bacterium]|nr:sigma-70 family RNA polymerase sigma factor [Planctomycetota bacterium]